MDPTKRDNAIARLLAIGAPGDTAKVLILAIYLLSWAKNINFGETGSTSIKCYS